MSTSDDGGEVGDIDEAGQVGGAGRAADVFDETLPPGLRESREALRVAWRRLRDQASAHDERSLPALHAVVDDLREILRGAPAVGLVLVGLRDLEAIEEAHGSTAADEVLAAAAAAAEDAVGHLLPSDARVAREGLYGEEVLLFVPQSAAADPVGLETLRRQAEALEHDVAARLASTRLVEGWDVRVASGHALVAPRATVRFERHVGRALARIQAMLADEDQRQQVRRRMELRQLLSTGTLRVAYQPIVLLSGLEIVGYEALCRGPAGTPFELADALFNAAQECELSLELDALCRQRVLDGPLRLRSPRALFLNVLPASILAGRLDASVVLPALEALGLDPTRLVLEISERGPVRDAAAFARALAPFRDAGARVALDDLGAGHASLRLASEIRPDFLKVDATLVKDIDTDGLKQGVLETIRDLGSRLGADVIAEGIETEGELAAVAERGIELGQGFLLGEPAPRPVAAITPPPGGASPPGAGSPVAAGCSASTKHGGSGPSGEPDGAGER